MEKINYNMYALYMHDYHSDIIEELVESICPMERESIEELKRQQQFDKEVTEHFLNECFDRDKIVNMEQEHEKFVFFLENSLDCFIQLYTQCESAMEMGELSSEIILYGRANKHIKNSPFNDHFQVRLKEVIVDIVNEKYGESRVGNKKMVRHIVRNVVAKFKELSIKSK